MDKKVALIVIYNHNFEKNIEKIKTIYGARFSTILQLMPFYRGDDPSVIGIYEASWQFNGYLAQALPRLLQEHGCSHYLIIGDDLILHPDLNEGNVCEKLGLDADTAYIHKMTMIDDIGLQDWYWAPYSFRRLLYPANRCEFQRFIPSIEEARRHCERHGLDWKQGLPGYAVHLSLESVDRPEAEVFKSWRRLRYMRKVARFCTRVEVAIRSKLGCQVDREAISRRYHQLATKRKLSTEYYYPLIDGFSDIMVVPAHKMAEFAHYCGVFAAMRIFVEHAVPMSMVFTMDKIRTEKDTPYQNVIVWNDNRRKLTEEHHGSFAHLQANWPDNVLYYHPLKLSQWTLDI